MCEYSQCHLSKRILHDLIIEGKILLLHHPYKLYIIRHMTRYSKNPGPYYSNNYIHAIPLLYIYRYISQQYKTSMTSPAIPIVPKSYIQQIAGGVPKRERESVRSSAAAAVVSKRNAESPSCLLPCPSRSPEIMPTCSTRRSSSACKHNNTAVQNST